MELTEITGEGVWFDLAQDREKWQSVVNTVRNFKFHRKHKLFD